MKRWMGLWLVCVLVIACGCARIEGPRVGRTQPEAELVREIISVLDTPKTSNAFWGIMIKRAGDRNPVLAINEGKSFMPASNMKLYTTASFLSFLGADFRFQTPVYHTGEIGEDGMLKGDIVIQGSGDPSISGRYRRGITTEEILEEWCNVLKARGIKSVSGNVIADDDYFTDEEVEGTWQRSNLSYWYTAPSSAISINDNLYQGYAYPADKVGEKARLELPDTNYMTIQNDVITTHANAGSYVEVLREIEGNHVRVYGRIALNDARERYRGCVYNATLYAATQFKEALEKNGITVNGEPKDIDDYSEEEKGELRENPRPLHVHVSPPLSEIVRIINKPSQNYYADMLLKNLGKRFRDEGSFDAGCEVVKDFLELAGAEGVDRFQMKDGSGLSRRNLVQPRHTIALLEYMTHSPVFDVFYDSLPIAGVDGTISRRMKEPPARGNVHAKTGFISHARALSGYVEDRNGDRWVFSCMCNHFMVSVSNIDAMIDKICQAVASYGG